MGAEGDGAEGLPARSPAAPVGPPPGAGDGPPGEAPRCAEPDGAGLDRPGPRGAEPGGAAGARAPEPTAAEVAGWLGALQAGQPGVDAALLLGHDGVLYVHHVAASPVDPLGPAAGLLLGLLERAGPSARWVSRRRVWCTRDHPLDRAAVQLGARRGRFDLRPGPLVAPLPPVVDLGAALAQARARARLRPAPPGPPLVAARALAQGAAASAGPLWTRDRCVGAVLVGPDGAPLGAAANQAGEHRLLHAEVALVLALLAARGAPLPAGGRLYVSLQPCRLCAALLVEVGVSEVIYDEPEPGRFGQATALGAAGRERLARPDERG